jgi:hypothetical protein
MESRKRCLAFDGQLDKRQQEPSSCVRYTSLPSLGAQASSSAGVQTGGGKARMFYIGGLYEENITAGSAISTTSTITEYTS